MKSQAATLVLTLVRSRKCILIATILAAVCPAHSQEAPGTACPPAQEPRFSVVLNGKTLELHDSDIGSFSNFRMTGTAEVAIHTGFDVRWVEVRPFSLQIQAHIAPTHRDVVFRLDGPTPVVVEFNDDLGHTLHLFPFWAEAEQPSASSANVIYFGPGIHDAGLIELKSGQSIYLAAGSWVRGAIQAHRVHDVAILGHGVLDASAAVSLTKSATPIYLEGTSNARIEGVTVFDSHGWTIHLRHADNTVIDGVRILNPGAWNGDDGIDINSSSHVRVQNVFIRTNDDCVVIKNMDDIDTSDIQVLHSVIWNMPNGGNGLEIGFETRHQRLHDILFEDINMLHIERGAAISIHNGDAAPIDNVTYQNIRVEDVRRKLIDFAILYAPYGPDRPESQTAIRDRMDTGGSWDAILCYLPSELDALSSRRGTIRHVKISNMQVVAGALPYSVMAGFDPKHRVQDVQIDNLVYQGRPLQDEHSARLALENTREIDIR